MFGAGSRPARTIRWEPPANALAPGVFDHPLEGNIQHMTGTRTIDRLRQEPPGENLPRSSGVAEP